MEVEPSRRGSLLNERCHDVNVLAEVERLLANYYFAGAFSSNAIFGSLAAEADSVSQF